MSELFDRGYAVIIGVGGDLPVTVDDAQAIADLLRDPERCGYPGRNVRLLTQQEARRDKVLEAFEWLVATTTPEDTAIVYYSGHGIETPDYYLLPFGFDLGDLSRTAISSGEFTQFLHAIRTQKLLVLLDCCHAGGQAEAKALPFTHSPLPVAPTEELDRGSGRVVIASSRKDEVSWTARPYSVFTMAVLEALAGHGAFEQDGYARVLDVALWVGRQVPERTQDNQHPIVKVSHLQDNFALAWYAAGAKSPRPMPWLPQRAPSASTATLSQTATWQRMLANFRENLLLIEERMSEYVEFSEIPLQLVRSKRQTEQRVAELEAKLGLSA